MKAASDSLETALVIGWKRFGSRSRDAPLLGYRAHCSYRFKCSLDLLRASCLLWGLRNEKKPNAIRSRWASLRVQLTLGPREAG